MTPLVGNLLYARPQEESSGRICHSVNGVTEKSATRNDVLGKTVLQIASDPVGRFKELLFSAMANGRAHVALRNGRAPDPPRQWGRERSGVTDENLAWEPCGVRIGWVDFYGLYLEAETYFAVVQCFASDCGETVPVGQKTLHKRLHERGLLRAIDAQRGRLTVRRTLEGRRRQVLQLRHVFLLVSESSHSARAGNAVQSGAASDGRAKHF